MPGRTWFHLYDILDKARPEGQKSGLWLWGFRWVGHKRTGQGLWRWQRRMEPLWVLIVVMITWLHVFVKIHRTVPQKESISLYINYKVHLNNFLKLCKDITLLSNKEFCWQSRNCEESLKCEAKIGLYFKRNSQGRIWTREQSWRRWVQISHRGWRWEGLRTVTSYWFCAAVE